MDNDFRYWVFVIHKDDKSNILKGKPIAGFNHSYQAQQWAERQTSKDGEFKEYTYIVRKEEY